MPEGEKHGGVPVVIGGDILPSPVGIGLTDLAKYWGARAPGPPVPASTSFIMFKICSYVLVGTMDLCLLIFNCSTCLSTYLQGLC